MACNICGSTLHQATTAGCPSMGVAFVYEGFMFPPPPIGWKCPVCNKGNAPDARWCGHCTRPGPLDVVGPITPSFTGKVTVVSNEPDLRYRKIQIRKTATVGW